MMKILDLVFCSGEGSDIFRIESIDKEKKTAYLSPAINGVGTGGNESIRNLTLVKKENKMPEYTVDVVLRGTINANEDDLWDCNFQPSDIKNPTILDVESVIPSYVNNKGRDDDECDGCCCGDDDYCDFCGEHLDDCECKYSHCCCDDNSDCREGYSCKSDENSACGHEVVIPPLNAFDRARWLKSQNKDSL